MLQSSSSSESLSFLVNPAAQCPKRDMTIVLLVGTGSTNSVPGSGLGTGILPDLIEKAGNSLRGGFRVTGRERETRAQERAEEVSPGLCGKRTPSSRTFSSAVSARCRRRDVIFTRLCSKAATRLA